MEQNTNLGNTSFVTLYGMLTLASGPYFRSQGRASTGEIDCRPKSARPFVCAAASPIVNVPSDMFHWENNVFRAMKLLSIVKPWHPARTLERFHKLSRAIELPWGYTSSKQSREETMMIQAQLQASFELTSERRGFARVRETHWKMRSIERNGVTDFPDIEV